MPELLCRAPVLDTELLARGANEIAALELLPPACQLVFRGGPSAAALAGHAIAVSFPNAVNTSAQAGAMSVLCLGPDEWLLIGPEAEEAQLSAALAHRLGDMPHSLVDVGHRNVALQLAGPGSADVLNAGCPLDLGHRAFPAGMCTRTILAKAPITLWKTHADSFYVSAERSYIQYVWESLVEARRGL
jgi:sarcosine oxidase subunit gamma